MNSLLFLITCFLVVVQFSVPRRIAFVPLLITVFHIPDIEILPDLSVIRILILAGLLRAFGGQIHIFSFRNSLDQCMFIWAGLAILTGFAHGGDDGNPVIHRIGMVFDYLGSYLYARAYIKDSSDIFVFGKCLALVLLPLAMLMLVEKVSGQNFYEPLGAVFKMEREGHIRVAGPFGNAILAGTAGGTSIPLVVMLFHYHRTHSIMGIIAACLIVFCSSSSGPYLTLFASIFALLMLRWNSYLVWIRRGTIAMLIGLHSVMNAPVWYLAARVDIGGGSTGHHRAELITQALNHIGEWWLTGTDYTRHWMPYGIQWSSRHVDITNYYLKMGILGGIPLMMAFVAILICAFGLIGRHIRNFHIARDPAEFTLWCLGASLFAHCVSFLGVAYFDQSFVLLFIVIGALPGLVSSPSQCSINNMNENAKQRWNVSRYKQTFIN